ncbi:thioredoxin family protein [Thaumasiovibrio subtropicus]|uniref:thioredoxin family protein n=1 Tax=Thaumasiovibrio subtropicus TaxID=1891207 RepID=UPI000B358C42|nr:co-chaperone YbbN [Thaumasiovibrio subtropicus]
MNSLQTVAITEQNIAQVIEQSMQQPVVINFWAASVPESIEVNQLLEKIVAGYPGLVTLATLDCEEQMMVAQQFGVRSLPTIAVFKQGQPADGIAGPQTEESLRELLSRHLPNENELAFNEANALAEQGDFQQAITIYRRILPALPQDSLVALALINALLETQQIDEAETLLATIPMQDQQTEYRALHSKLELLKQAGNSPEIQQLEAKLSQSPDDEAIRYELAVQYHQVNRNEDALELLMGSLRKDLNAQDGQVKKVFMDIVTALGQGNPIANQYRRQLYTLLY